MDSKTPEAVTSCPSWHCPKRSGYTSNASLFWKMPLAVASSQEAAEFFLAQPVRCERGFQPNHIRVQCLDSGSVSLIPMERMGRAKARKRKAWRAGWLCFVLYKETVVERWSERADILKWTADCFVNEQASVNCYQVISYDVQCTTAEKFGLSFFVF